MLLSRGSFIYWASKLLNSDRVEYKLAHKLICLDFSEAPGSSWEQREQSYKRDRATAEGLPIQNSAARIGGDVFYDVMTSVSECNP